MSVWFGEVEFNNEKRTVHHHTTVQLSNHTYGKVTAHWVKGKQFEKVGFLRILATEIFTHSYGVHSFI